MVPKQWCDIWHYLSIRFVVEVEREYYMEPGICDDLVCVNSSIMLFNLNAYQVPSRNIMWLIHFAGRLHLLKWRESRHLHIHGDDDWLPLHATETGQWSRLVYFYSSRLNRCSKPPLGQLSTHCLWGTHDCGCQYCFDWLEHPLMFQ